MKYTTKRVTEIFNLIKIDYHPVLFKSLKNYNRQTFTKDVISGIMVGIVALPLAIAFGIASGVTPDKGIISCVIAGIFVSIFGGSKSQISGPTGALIVIVSGIISTYGLAGLAIATFISGILLILMGVFKAGTIIKLIPYPIVIGFTSGIAVTIFTSQLKDVFGFSIETLPASFLEKWWLYISSINLINYWSLALALLTIVIIRICAKVSNKLPSFLIAIIIITFLSYALRSYFNIYEIQTIGDKFIIDAQIPTPSSLGLSFESIKNLFSAGVTIAIFGSIVTLLSATVADGVTGQSHNPNTELIGQGIANIISPIFGGTPITGAIARTLTNVKNGGKTPVAGIVHALILLIIMLFLGNLSKHIPMACLAGILVIVAYNMSEWRLFISMMKNPKADVIVLLVTFSLTVLFDLTIAIEVGLLLAVVMFIRRTSKNSTILQVKSTFDTMDGEDADGDDSLVISKGIEIYEIEGPFFFGLANKFDEFQKMVSNRAKVRIIRMRNVPFIDSSGLHNLETLAKRSHKDQTKFLLSGVKPSVRKTIEKSSLINIIGTDNVFESIQSALEKANNIIETLENNEKNKK